jgi:hypothetical protein
MAYVLRDLAFAHEQVDRALTLNPNLAGAWIYSGWIHLWSGNPTTAIEHLSGRFVLGGLTLDPQAADTRAET